MNTRPSLRALLLSLPILSLVPAGDVAAGPPTDGYERVAHLISRATFESVPALQRRMLIDAASDPTPRGVAACFDGPMPWDYVAAFNTAIRGPVPEFQLGTRWLATATNPGPLLQGDPTVITYSFVPDGVSVGGGIGTTGPNVLNATLTSLFGSAAAWQAQFHASFQRWGELIGVTYVHEPNDDGAPLFGSPGVLGVRGDVRIAGRNIDGASSVLAFNFFPSSGGDMVLDTGDTAIWGDATNNYRRLRNVIMHEHGHGLGLEHVCPAVGTKLMEPFLATGFDGPQLDDVLGGNRGYGDRLEHNDGVATASGLGALQVGSTLLSDLSIDDDQDEDWFVFSVAQPQDVSITLRPTGTSYLQGPQTSQCNTGSAYDSRTIHDLGFELLESNGTSSIALVDAAGIGGTESLPAFPLDAAGTYWLRVFGSAVNDIQIYELQVDVAPFTPRPFTIEFPSGAPTQVRPDAVTMVDVATTNLTGAPDPATARLFFSIDGGAFSSTPLLQVSPNGFQAPLPSSPCLARIEWYVGIDPQGGGTTVVAPFGAPASNVLVSTAGDTAFATVFSDDFNTDRGWSVTNDATLTGGAWQRGVPVGGGTRGDPAVDADGSGAAFVTENVAGNSDVDGGRTILTSPPIDLSAVGEAILRFEFWYDNDFGNNPGEDAFLIELDTGSGFTLLESYNASVDAWVSREVRLAASASSVRLRFTAQDLGGGSVVEAGVDAVQVLACIPAPTLDPSCAAGNTGVGGEPVLRVNGTAGGTGRRVVVTTGQAVVFETVPPSTATAPPPFAIFGYAGVPGPTDVLTVPGIGSICVGFASVSSGPLVIPATPAPWRLVLPTGAPAPLELTLQGVMLESASALRVTNGVILEAKP